MEIRERDNNLLYGVSPQRFLSGYLPQNKDVDLCVESYIYEGYSEKEAANFTACDLIRKYSVLTSSNITKKVSPCCSNFEIAGTYKKEVEGAQY